VKHHHHPRKLPPKDAADKPPTPPNVTTTLKHQHTYADEDHLYHQTYNSQLIHLASANQTQLSKQAIKKDDICH